MDMLNLGNVTEALQSHLLWKRNQPFPTIYTIAPRTLTAVGYVPTAKMELVKLLPSIVMPPLTIVVSMMVSILSEGERASRIWKAL